jgi:bacterioferritin (cytochrome b1)
MSPTNKTYTYKGQTFASERDMVLYLLDDYRCVEGFAARYLGAWKSVSQEACITGGLRTVCGREQLHADLLEARLRELGGTPQCEVPENRLAELDYYGSTDHSDIDKLGKLAARVQEPDKVLHFLTTAIEQIDDDQDTRELLATILDDERSSLQWITSSWERLQPRA